MPRGLPGGAIAQGWMFAIFGAGLGPATGVPQPSFPLTTTLGDTGITITQGAKTVNAIPVYASAGQVNAVMPSNGPLGAAALRVTYNSAASNPMPVLIVNSAFGIFAAGALLSHRLPAGIASIGGMASALPAGIVTARLLRFSFAQTLDAFGAIAYAAPFAAAVARFGCFLAHDHRGPLSHGWLAVQFPEGTRYDLGLVECLFLCALSLLFWRLGRKFHPSGFFIGLGAATYGLFRIWRDTLDMIPHSTGGAPVALCGAIAWLAASGPPQRVWRNTRRLPSHSRIPL